MCYDEIIKALQIIIDICKENSCSSCPFRSIDKKCGIQHNGTPAYWLITTDIDWRAFK